jgi:hypothetical protein
VGGILEDEMLAPARHFRRAFHFMKNCDFFNFTFFVVYCPQLWALVEWGLPWLRLCIGPFILVMPSVGPCGHYPILYSPWKFVDIWGVLFGKRFKDKQFQK